MRRIAITGMGIVSCLGNQLDRVSAALRSGLSGIRRDEAAVEAGLRSQVSGAPDIDLPARIDRKVLRFMGDGAAFAHVAMQDAIADAGGAGPLVGQLVLLGREGDPPHLRTMRLGQVMMVHYQNEGLMGHPMHMHQPVGWIIAKDGVPLLVPQPADTIWVAPGERYTVLYKAADLGVWAWHCHILSHAEGPQGMFGMVTALIVTP